MKFIKNVWKVICYPLLYMAMQTIVSAVYSLTVGFIIIVEDARKIIELSSDEIIDLLLEKMDFQAPLIISLLITLLIICLIKNNEWKNNKFWRLGGCTTVTVLHCVVLGIAMNIFTIGILSLTNADKFFPEYGKMMESITSGNFILQIIFIALLAPFVEEIIFRGVVLDSLSKMIKIAAGIVIQAVLFAIIHLNILQGIYVFVIGIVLGLVFVWLDSIWAAVAVHIAYNTASLIISKFGGQDISWPVFVNVMLISLLAMTGTLIMLYKKGQIRETMAGEINNNESEKSQCGI